MNVALERAVRTLALPGDATLGKIITAGTTGQVAVDLQDAARVLFKIRNGAAGADAARITAVTFTFYDLTELLADQQIGSALVTQATDAVVGASVDASALLSVSLQAGGPRYATIFPRTYDANDEDDPLPLLRPMKVTLDIAVSAAGSLDLFCQAVLFRPSTVGDRRGTTSFRR